MEKGSDKPIIYWGPIGFKNPEHGKVEPRTTLAEFLERERQHNGDATPYVLSDAATPETKSWWDFRDGDDRMIAWSWTHAYFMDGEEYDIDSVPRNPKGG